MAQSYTQRDWYNLLIAEARRQRRNEGKRETEQAGLPTVYRPTGSARLVACQPQPLPTMSVPACLMQGSAAGEARRAEVLLTRDYWLRRERKVPVTLPPVRATRFASLHA
jgi:hypothetical protein